MGAERHTGGCQCGAVRYEVDVDTSAPIACNCSRCGRLGLNLVFAPLEAFALKSGEGSLTEYTFNKHRINHQFCKVCGVQSFAYGQKPDGSRMAAINLRCIDGVNVHDLDPKKVDGRNF